jgi:hypothetical protein
MTIQQYLMVNKSTNIVDNICLWDGDTNTWQPPEDILMLVQADIQAYIWAANYTTNPYSWGLVLQLGAGAIGFTWDGSVLTTNDPRPAKPPTLENPAPNQPTTSGTVTI